MGMEYRDFYTETLDEHEDYRGEHMAPTKDSGDPMHNLGGTYPDDIYSFDGARLYGDNHGDAADSTAIAIIRSAKGRPHARVKVYRAVPKLMSRDDKIAEIETQKRYILKMGRVPPNVTTSLNSSKYYDILCNQLYILKASPAETDVKKIGIEDGNWVTIDKNYAIEHGKASLGGRFRILSKTVSAKNLFTDGNSVNEWGYDAS